LNKRNKGFMVLISVVLALCFAFVGWLFDKEETPITMSAGCIRVHFIDVGQGDCILIQLPDDEIMLVDAGEAEKGENVTRYLDEIGVKKVDYLVGTHPHSDHIGGLQGIIEKYKIGKIYMPKVNHDSMTFENLLMCIKEKGMQIESPKKGEIIYQKDDVKIQCLSDSELEYDNLNDYSIVLKVTHKNRSFLLTGDAENEILDVIDFDGKVDVLKVPHHGAETSCSEAFYEKIKPQYAVISVGANNQYGHPKEETLDVIDKYDAKCLRTDKQGTIVFETDGEYLKLIEKGE